MEADSEYSLEKYEKMAAPTAPSTDPSKPSSVWRSFLGSITNKQFNPFENSPQPATTISGQSFLNRATYNAALADYFEVQTTGAGIKRVPKGDPDKVCSAFPAADRYMAKCVSMQYKMSAVPTGVYTVKCTEGTVKQQAEETRSAALSAQFRMKQRSVKQKFGDYTETRRKAIIAAMGCSYEEKLVDKYPAAARAVVMGSSEAKGTCVRYAMPSSPVEKYMAASVDKQYKFRAVPYGVYDVLCSDGNAKNVAEYKRVFSLSTRFRAMQMSKQAKEQAKFDSAKYARDYYGHGCTYEEKIFNQHPAVAASMRPDTARY